VADAISAIPAQVVIFLIANLLTERFNPVTMPSRLF
jgi:hypothetical protein